MDLQPIDVLFPAEYRSALTAAAPHSRDLTGLAAKRSNTCGQPATLISRIQGAGVESPLAGQQHTVEAIVTGLFSGKDQLRGFFVQEERADQDADPATSEGLFIFDPEGRGHVRAGDLVRVTGKVSEFGGMTQLAQPSRVEICANGVPYEDQPLTLPLTAELQLEALEGMAVSLSQTLTVADLHHLGRFGEVQLSLGRLFIPTQLATPGPKAQAIARANRLNQILLDDGSTRQNPPVIAYPSPGLSAARPLRVGDQVRRVSAVVAEGFGRYRLHPLQAVRFNAVNARPGQPRPVNPDPAGPSAPANATGKGHVRVASFNLQNYFNGDGRGGGFPAPRGASSRQEFERQRAKVLAALQALDAQIIGLMELENDGYAERSAVQDLLRGLNGKGRRFRVVVPPTKQLGNDEISVGRIYDADRLEPEGPAATLASYPFDGKNRQPLAQTFRLTANQAKVTVVVNHFKSKNCTAGVQGRNADTGDGQGCWNGIRTEAAIALSRWLAGNPTGQNDGRVLILGDLNAYAQEDPLRALTTAGYQDLLQRFAGTTAYTYVYQGQAGYLDHALASPALAQQVTAAAAWHINADEPPALDYNLEFKSPRQQQTLYQPDPFRSSDHDPVVVDLDLQP